MLGLYGVTKRTNEIGVRMALGAGRGAVLTMILREAALLIAAGIGAGLVIALAAGKLAATLLYGITPHEPTTLASANRGTRGGRTPRQLLAGAGCDED